MNVKFKRICSAMMALVTLLSIAVVPARAETLSEKITLSFGDVAIKEDGTLEVDINASTDSGAESFELSATQIYFIFPVSEMSYTRGVNRIPARANEDEENVPMTVNQMGGDKLTDANEKGYGFIYISDAENINHVLDNNAKLATLRFTLKSDAPKAASSQIKFGVHESLDAATASFMLKAYPDKAADEYALAFGDAKNLFPDPQTCTVTYKANGGVGDDVTETVNQGASVVLKPADTFAAPTGKEFKAWDVNGEEKAPGESVAVSADTEIKAVWKDPDPVTVTVTYKANGGAGDDVTETVNKGASVVLKPADTFAAPTGKRFKAWDVNGAEVQPGAQIEITADTTIKVIWENIPANPDGSSSSGGGCYVATAVYGSYDCPQVWTLRRFRDNVLAQTWYGRLFIKAYYAVSPTCVKLFGDTEIFQNFFRNVLDPWVAQLQEDGFESTPYNDIDW